MRPRILPRVSTALLALLIACSAHAQHCIPSGVTDQFTYFVAVDATDLTTFETGLSSFTVYRSRNGGAAAAFTTPTINETDATNMAGTYELLLDEDMTIDAGDDVQHMALRITHAGMAPVTKEICIARAKTTAGETLTVSSGVATANTTQIEGGDATDALDTAADTVTVTSMGNDTITAAAIAAAAITTSEIDINVSEPVGIPAWGDDLENWIAYIGAWYRNEVQQTATTKTLRNDADDGDLVTCGVSDNGTTFQVDECATAP